ncbi:hypothetical protein pipiens_010306 [Culex pipiens pipiens]|uniref:F-box/LRR-repeat protein 15/At3g58940/PEG3-like LRR domain-containing protein n=1 Tax=Culex pipiens pipiens TaxID=38569 RepID=A0ABD1DAQ6_CULPP
MASCATCGLFPAPLDTIQQMATRLTSIEDTLRNLTSILLPRQQLGQFLQSCQTVSCRSWKRIVDGNPALVEKFEVRFPENLVMDREFQPGGLLPVCGATLKRARIVSVETWWTSLGANLRRLKLVECKVSLATLVGMLGGTPSLEVLELIQVGCSGICNRVENFRLAKLEQLTIEGLEGGVGLLNVFGQVCTGLKEVRLRVELTEVQSERRVIRFLQSVRNTLESVEVFATSKILYELTALKQIRLKRAAFIGFWIDEKELMEFSRKQATLEELDIPEVVTTVETLNEIGTNLPSLTRLAVKIDSEAAVVPTFLANMPHLTDLAISGVYATHQLLNLTAHGSANLTQLKLSNVRVTCCSLQRFCAASANVRVLELKCCAFESWSEIFAAVAPCRKLERLQLDRVRVNRSDVFLVAYFDSLRYLELSDCQLSKEMLAALFGLCPQLEEVYLWRMANFDAEVMLGMCQKLKRLKKLTFNDCLFGDDFADCVVNHCQQLEELSVLFCDKLSNRSEALLRTTRNIRLRLK